MQEEKIETVQKQYHHTVVAVTACPAGIAHTYMAADALVKAGEELGVKVYVEKQGANGVEDRHTAERLNQADAAIFAVEVAVKESERFEHLPTYKTRVAAPIRDGKAVIQAALKLAEETGKKGEYKQTETTNSGEKNSVMEDIAFAVLLAQGFGLNDLLATEGSWLWSFKQMGSGLLGTIMIPVLSAYMA